VCLSHACSLALSNHKTTITVECFWSRRPQDGLCSCPTVEHKATLYCLLHAAPSSPATYTRLANSEYVGLNLPGITSGCSATVSSVQGCANLCAATAGCSAFSYTGALASCVGGCWLKYGSSTTQTRTTSQLWTSGVVTGMICIGERFLAYFLTFCGSQGIGSLL
jgi:hypothetical protein